MNKHHALPDNQRVVVTGVGMATPLGTGRKEFSRRLFGGEGAIDVVQAFDTGRAASRLGAEVRGFEPRGLISVKNLRRMDRLSMLTTASARLALSDAGVSVTAENRDRVGILFGSAFGATDVTAQFEDTLFAQGPGAVNPILVPNTVMNAPAGHASIELGFRGVNVTVTHFAVSAETAVAYAVSEIRRGTADVLLAGGADILSKFYYEALSKFHGLSPDDGGAEGARPFDRRRNGYVAGEGCGLLCLESLSGARKRGANIYCEISGAGLGSSPAPPTAWPKDPEGFRRTFLRALGQARIDLSDVSAVMAAANGSRALDAVEAAAYEELFASCADRPWVTSIKGAVGESFSGGGIRACALALSVEKGGLPPTVGLEQPAAPLNFVTGKKVETNLRHTVLSGISFGGTYACLVFSRCEK
ncbi:MAG TPA: beta-ketoacyl-[acyl-carrier-protein] synthase family protein [Smithellaceae bacterium]|nr:beta-ketoacyl-[acyl-carrier-protein] synthase family protein [Smithellaceae bacterium]